MTATTNGRAGPDRIDPHPRDPARLDGGRLAIDRGPRRPSMMAIGALFVVGSALAGALLVHHTQRTVAALALSSDLDAGEVLAAEDLMVVELAPTPGLAWTAVDQQDRLIGLSARGPLATGHLVTPAMFAERSSVIGGHNVVVPMALSGGDVPPSARAGDEVRLHAFGTAPAVSADAVIWSITPGGSGSGDVIVSLLVAAVDERAVTGAVATGRVIVTLVGRER